MAHASPAPHTILSGDLAASTGLERAVLEQAFEGLQQAAEDIGGWHGQSVHFTRNRGDGWQICLPGARPGLREALTLRAGLRARGKGLGTRIALATGPVDLPGSGDLNQASGPGFTRAGRLLDSLSREEMDHASGGALSATLILAAEISRGWTQAQARAILPMLAPDPPTQAEVAARHGITRPAIYRALTGGGFPALSRAIAALEKTR